jgi:hypothetical protein
MTIYEEQHRMDCIVACITNNYNYGIITDEVLSSRKSYNARSYISTTIYIIHYFHCTPFSYYEMTLLGIYLEEYIPWNYSQHLHSEFNVMVRLQKTNL